MAVIGFWLVSLWLFSDLRKMKTSCMFMLRFSQAPHNTPLTDVELLIRAIMNTLPKDGEGVCVCERDSHSTISVSSAD